jgi:hypothetical protein
MVTNRAAGGIFAGSRYLKRICARPVVFAPSNPLGVATQNTFRTGLRVFKKRLKRIITSPVAGPSVPIDGRAGEQKLGELSTSFLRLAPVPDDLKARQDGQTSADVASLLLEASPCVAGAIPKFPLGCLIQRWLASELFIGYVAVRVEADQCSGLLLEPVQVLLELLCLQLLNLDPGLGALLGTDGIP